MSCCGQRRNPQQQQPAEAASAPAPPAPASPPPALRYLGASPLLIRGPRSGRVYSLEVGAVINVDRRDAESLVSSRWFDPEPASSDAKP